MALPDQQIGILDFQDAFVGPVTYDAVSLLRDCYIDWPPQQVIKWRDYYFTQLLKQGVLAQQDQQKYQRWFDWMGIQRHLKALLTFARKHVRDQQPQYLRHIPRTLNYIVTIAQQYPEMKALADFYARIVKPAAEKEIAACGQ
jgi:aminoglycoside/choline kinase family phosphotransferase